MNTTRRQFLQGGGVAAASLAGLMAPTATAAQHPLESFPDPLPPAARKAGRIVGEGAAAVPALMDALRNEAKIL